jgi:hypothetical protein
MMPVEPLDDSVATAAGAAGFARAVDAFDVAELPVEVDGPAAARLRTKLAAGGPILVGERYGVEQNPLVAYTLMHRLGIRVLALGWCADLAPVVDRFLGGQMLDAAALARRDDGRVTAGHLAVVRALYRDGQLDRVVLLEPAIWPRTWSERDHAMAERLLQESEGQTALVLAGSLHTRLRRHRHGEPMGAHLARVRPGTVEVRLRYPGLGAPSVCRCALRSAGAWLELTVPNARRAVTPGG